MHAAEGLKINLPPLHHSLASRCHCVACDSCEGGREGEEILLAAADYEMHVALRGGAMVEGMKFLFLSSPSSSFITSEGRDSTPQNQMHNIIGFVNSKAATKFTRRICICGLASFLKLLHNRSSLVDRRNKFLQGVFNPICRRVVSAPHHPMSQSHCVAWRRSMREI